MADVQLAHPYDGNEPGDRITVDEETARRLLTAGYAVPATKPEAEKLGVDPEQAATAKKK